MNNYKITIQYDGTRYKGWQVLKNNDATIQGKLQNVLTRFTGTETAVIGSGRTDAGVHARGQIANFYADESFTSDQLLDALNSYLPDDIAITDISPVPERFHARYNATSKSYSYHICTAKKANVFENRFVYHYGKPLDIEAMQSAAKQLVGTHDFTSFCGNSHFKKSAIRTIFSIDIHNSNDIITITYTGDGFLQNMIRILTGTLIEIGNGTRSKDCIPELIEQKNRACAGYTAPPQGLFLEKVEYL